MTHSFNRHSILVLPLEIIPLPSHRDFCLKLAVLPPCFVSYRGYIYSASSIHKNTLRQSKLRLQRPAPACVQANTF